MEVTTTCNNEQSLVVRLINGEQDAFCQLYSDYKDRLIYFAVKFLKSQEFAEDLFQDTFTQIWLHRQFIDPTLPFSSFVYTLMRNRIFNELRRIAHHSNLQEELKKIAVDYSTDTQDTIQFNELNQLLTEALTFLSPREREIFEMSRTESLSHKQIAEELGISTHTVQTHISSSLKTIRKHLSARFGLYADLLLIWVCLNQ